MFELDYVIKYTNGNTESHTAKFDDNDIDSSIKIISEIQAIFNESILNDAGGVVRLSTTKGFVIISTKDIQSVLIVGLDRFEGIFND